MRGKFGLLLLVLIIISVVVFALQIVLGSVAISLTEIWEALTGSNEVEQWKQVIIASRFNQAVVAFTAGAALSVSGLQMQTLFKNPVAGPYVLGISSGASLGVALLLMGSSAIGWQIADTFSFLSGWAMIGSAITGATVVYMLNMLISFRLRNVVSLLIIGLMLGSSISALIEVLQAFSSKDSLRQFVLWTFGSFQHVSPQQTIVMGLAVCIGLVIALLISKPLDVMLLSDNYAITSGVSLNRVRLVTIASTTILAGAVTAFCGPIGFVGLAVPHIARITLRTHKHLHLTFSSAIIGGIVCCGCNIVASLPGLSYALPLNAVTAMLGAPFVIYIILHRKE